MISRTGRYKPFPIAGTAIMTVAVFLLSRLEVGTPTWAAAACMVAARAGSRDGDAGARPRRPERRRLPLPRRRDLRLDPLPAGRRLDRRRGVRGHLRQPARRRAGLAAAGGRTRADRRQPGGHPQSPARAARVVRRSLRRVAATGLRGRERDRAGRLRAHVVAARGAPADRVSHRGARRELRIAAGHRVGPRARADREPAHARPRADAGLPGDDRERRSRHPARRELGAGALRRTRATSSRLPWTWPASSRSIPRGSRRASTRSSPAALRDGGDMAIGVAAAGERALHQLSAIAGNPGHDDAPGGLVGPRPRRADHGARHFGGRRGRRDRPAVAG